MTAISDKYRLLGGPQGFLGAPTTGENILARPIGARYQHFEHGSIYSSLLTGAFEVHGGIRQAWAGQGWEQGLLGFPISDEKVTADGRGRYSIFQRGLIIWNPQTGAQVLKGGIPEKWACLDFENGPLGNILNGTMEVQSGLRTLRFSNGSIAGRTRPLTPLRIFFQNMALLVPKWEYKGKERSKAVEKIIAVLRRDPVDVAGLSEVFDDSERKKIKQELIELYPYSISGPNRKDFNGDGGLLLLSRHPFSDHNQSIYQYSTRPDSWATKGLLHLRISAATQGQAYDIFLSHTQNPNAGDGTEARADLYKQISHLDSYIRSVRDPIIPVILMGDLNVNVLLPDQLGQLNARLNSSTDTWEVAGNTSRWPLGITADDHIAFGKDEPALPMNDPSRHQIGKRKDLILSWGGMATYPVFSNTEVVQEETSAGRDLSDHYGIRTTISSRDELTTVIQQVVRQLVVKLVGFHCLEDTTGVGEDEVFFVLTARSQNQPTWANEVRSPTKKKIEPGVQIHYGAQSRAITLVNPGQWVEIKVRGKEKDKLRDDSLGEQILRISLQEMLESHSRKAIRALPRFTGRGAVYVTNIELSTQ
jgi:endonuclease/exonuclease/phosphatase family metal-dependent hydrolase